MVTLCTCSLMKDFPKRNKETLYTIKAQKKGFLSHLFWLLHFYRQETEAQRGWRLFLSGGLERTNKSRAGRLRTMWNFLGSNILSTVSVGIQMADRWPWVLGLLLSILGAGEAWQALVEAGVPGRALGGLGVGQFQAVPGKSAEPILAALWARR